MSEPTEATPAAPAAASTIAGGEIPAGAVFVQADVTAQIDQPKVAETDGVAKTGIEASADCVTHDVILNGDAHDRVEGIVDAQASADADAGVHATTPADAEDVSEVDLHAFIGESTKVTTAHGPAVGVVVPFRPSELRTSRRLEDVLLTAEQAQTLAQITQGLMEAGEPVRTRIQAIAWILDRVAAAK